jgi:hypothetical protein
MEQQHEPTVSALAENCPIKATPMPTANIGIIILFVIF